MTKERIEEIANQLNRIVQPCPASSHDFIRLLSALPEFQEPRWIKCSERMPVDKNGFEFATRVDGIEQWQNQTLKNGRFCTGTTHWICYDDIVPAPPGKEDSPAIRALEKRRAELAAIVDADNKRRSFSGNCESAANRAALNEFDTAIEIVRRCEGNTR